MPALSQTEEARLIRQARARSRAVGVQLTLLLVGMPLLIALDFVGGHGPIRGWSLVAGVMWAFSFGVMAVRHRWWRQERADQLAQARRTLLNRFAGTPDTEDVAATGSVKVGDPRWDALVARCQAAGGGARERLPAMRAGIDDALAALDRAETAVVEAHEVLGGAGPSVADEIDAQIAQLDGSVARKNDPRLEALYTANRSRLVERREAVARAAATRTQLHGAAAALAVALESEPLERDAVSQALGALRRAVGNLPRR